MRQRLAKHVATLALAVMTIVMTHCQLTPSAEHHCPFQDKSSNDSPEAASAAVVTHLLHRQQGRQQGGVSCNAPTS